MAYQKRSGSGPYDRLSYRVEALKTIEPDFDMGGGLSATELTELADSLRKRLNAYNATLMEADDLRTAIIGLEKQAQDAAERLLATTLALYGRDSTEYRRVGGTRKSEILHTGSRPLTFQPLTGNGSGNGEDGGESGT